MNLNINPSGYATKFDYWQELAAELARLAEADGVIITIERASVEPLAMRNHIAVIQAYAKR